VGDKAELTCLDIEEAMLKRIKGGLKLFGSRASTSAEQPNAQIRARTRASSYRFHHRWDALSPIDLTGQQLPINQMPSALWCHEKLLENGLPS
jgi:hypothetical protein